MTQQSPHSVYEMSFNFRVEWQAHSLSNTGTQQSNRTLPRQQLLADGSEVDAINGNLAKQRHASILREYMAEQSEHLCSACAVGDPRRAAAAKELSSVPTMEDILSCGLCDTHGFLITGKKATGDGPARSKRFKGTLIDFSMALAIPEQCFISPQLFTRHGATNRSEEGEGQMIFKSSSRSGQYAFVVRFKAAGIGVDTESMRPVINDRLVRNARYQNVLYALHDQMLSPSGASTARLLPHVTGLRGAIILRTLPGRAPVFSPLKSDFVNTLRQLCNIQNGACTIYEFDSVVDFSKQMYRLVEETTPYTIGTN